MKNFFEFFWPALCIVLAGLWLWTRSRLHRAASEIRFPVSGRPYQPAEAEDILKIAYSFQEEGRPLDEKELSQAAGLPGELFPEIAGALIASQWAKFDPPGVLRLTETGEDRARELIRAHRLLERYLADRKGMPIEAIHAEAHQREHEMTPQEIENLDRELEYPAWDPHGHVIPAQGRRIPSPKGRGLSEVAAPGRRLRILSVDDEPMPLLAQLLALGLKPGAVVDIVGQQSGVWTLRLDNKTIPLALEAARHVFVIPAPALAVRLGELPLGSRVRIVEIVGSGKHQRRLLDMGFVPGAEVTVIRKAPLNDPIAYRVKGTDVALRQNDADSILAEELGNG
ncbi:MAG: metal-dependent transcriptional regulator [Candidatus Aminicenantes bacterium]|nr:metal-dependent transcriptional regulator [Candidatus Aminicenantes bacterium]